MDDIIIIILTLVLTIVAALNSSKKKKTQQQTQEQENEPGFWTSILRGEEPDEFHIPQTPGYDEGSERPTPAWNRTPYGGEAEQKPAPVKKPVTITQKMASAQRTSGSSFRFKGELTDTGLDEGIRNETISDLISRQLEDEETNGEKTGILTDFSLRKAVIYTEILTPKYF